MGAFLSCSSKGALLLAAAHSGDIAQAHEILRRHPSTATWHNFADQSSPLIQAAARGHFDLLQAILEAAVAHEGVDIAKSHCIDHTNCKRQTALILACKHGHPDSVEYLITNGADPLITDIRRRNTCLHYASLYGRSECVHNLLSARTPVADPRHGGAATATPVSRIPCRDDLDGSISSFIDLHNGWGLTALHLAVFQGSTSTVRALLRHGASLSVKVRAPRVENSPVRCARGSNVLHIAGYTGNVAMVKLLLEAQLEAGLLVDMRSEVNERNQKPVHFARRVRSPVLEHVLDERLPVVLLRQIWSNYALDTPTMARTHTLQALLLKLKLMFTLELLKLQQQEKDSSQRDSAAPASNSNMQAGNGAASIRPAAGGGGAAAVNSQAGGCPDAAAAAAVPPGWGSLAASGNNSSGGGVIAVRASAAADALAAAISSKQQRQAEVQKLFGTITRLVDMLGTVLSAAPAAAPAAAGAAAGECGSGGGSAAATAAVGGAPLPGCPSGGNAAGAAALPAIPEPLDAQLIDNRSLDNHSSASLSGSMHRSAALPGNEAALDFILSSLIIPRTVYAILHAAKHLVCTTVAVSSGRASSAQPASELDVAHGMLLLGTAFKAIEVCLHAAMALATGSEPSLAAMTAAAELSGLAVSGSSSIPAAAALTVAAPPAPSSTAALGGSVPASLPSLSPTNSEAGSSVAAAPAASATAAQQRAADFAAPVGVGPSSWGEAASLPAAHWSTHLNALIAQLQWDIGLQRHRRMRSGHGSRRGEAAPGAAVPASTASVSVQFPSDAVAHHPAGAANAAAATAGAAPQQARQAAPTAYASAPAAAAAAATGAYSLLPLLIRSSSIGNELPGANESPRAGGQMGPASSNSSGATNAASAGQRRRGQEFDAGRDGSEEASPAAAPDGPLAGIEQREGREMGGAEGAASLEAGPAQGLAERRPAPLSLGSPAPQDRSAAAAPSTAAPTAAATAAHLPPPLDEASSQTEASPADDTDIDTTPAATPRLISFHGSIYSRDDPTDAGSYGAEAEDVSPSGQGLLMALGPGSPPSSRGLSLLQQQGAASGAVLAAAAFVAHRSATSQQRSPPATLTSAGRLRAALQSQQRSPAAAAATGTGGGGGIAAAAGHAAVAELAAGGDGQLMPQPQPAMASSLLPFMGANSSALAIGPASINSDPVSGLMRTNDSAATFSQGDTAVLQLGTPPASGRGSIDLSQLRAGAAQAMDGRIGAGGGGGGGGGGDGPVSRVEEEGGGVGRLEQEDALSSGENTPGRGLPLMGASGNGQMQQVSSKLVGGGLSKEDKGGSSNDSNSNDGWSDEQADANVCSICMDHAVAVLVAGCAHGLCIQCAFQLCAKGRDLPCCPFCRQKIHGFDTAPGTAAAD